MYIIRNALRNIGRSMGRNILVGVIVLVIAVSSCVALSIKQAAATAKATGLANKQITGQITVDRSALMAKAQTSSGSADFRSNISSIMSSVPELTLTELQKYTKSQYVKSFYYTVTSSVDSGADAFAPYQDTTTTSSSTSSASSSGSKSASASAKNKNSMPEGDMMGGRWGEQGDFSITGYGSEDAMTNFISGTDKVTSGSMIDLAKSDNTCLISNLLATYNSLKVGDTITIANPNSTSEVYKLTISGIYTNSSSSSSSDAMRFSTSNDPANKIITSVGTLNTIVAHSTSVATTSTNSQTGTETTTALRSNLTGTYVFENVDAYNSFKTDVTKLGLSSDYTVTSSDVTAYEESLVPLENLSSFAGIFLLIVLVVGGIVLMVLNIFNIHERKYEVGVLTAIGMKKVKVALQYVTELFVVTIFCILVGAAAGAVISVPVSNKLLASQISAQQSQSRQVAANFGRGRSNQTNTAAGGNMPSGGFGNFMNRAGRGVVSYVSDINAATNWSVVLEMLGIGVLLTIISSIAAVVIILRYEPLKILTSRT